MKRAINLSLTLASAVSPFPPRPHLMEHERETRGAHSAGLWSWRGAQSGTHIRGEDAPKGDLTSGHVLTKLQNSSPVLPPALSLSLAAARTLLFFFFFFCASLNLGPSLTICLLTCLGTRGVDDQRREDGWREEKGKAKRERMRGGCWSWRGRRLALWGDDGGFFPSFFFF